ncbi:MAG TPA: CRISPR-associated helicase Cas3' [Clostridiales bacterium]|nr:CRISPR-associated helicase Cas3' [Clostridiales bacterium]
MNRNKVFYAKPDETYEEHILEVYRAWKELIYCKQSLIDRLVSRFQFSKNQFLKMSLLTIVFHDIGKLIQPFQDIMERRRKGIKIDYKNNYRHELCSLPYVFSASLAMNNMEHFNFPYDTFAVMGHHKDLDFSKQSFHRELKWKKKRPHIERQALEHAISFAETIFKDCGWEFPIMRNNLINDEGIHIMQCLIEGLPALIVRDDPYKIRTLYAVTKGLLHYSDWYGSAKLTIRYRVNQKSEDVVTHIKSRCIKRGISFNGLRKFQKEVANCKGHVIAIAPTGSGKTEAALMWALNNIDDLGNAKLLYLLPTMATANSIWFRLSTLFGQENVGLSHSSAKLLFDNEEEELEYENIKEIYQEFLFNKTFTKPVTVATVDQLLTTGFNAGHWTLKELNAMNSVIVMDEIHAYDGWTLGLIVSSIKHFSALGTRFMLMSATMPKYLIRMFRKILKDSQVIRDEELLEEQRSKYYFKNCYIEDDIDNIISTVESGFKVLVVVNTVGLCQKLAQILAQYNPICYHSRFIFKDRKRIEDSIERANFVIATQVVEVSLDIDFDWMFTECAPPDALAQRAGRVNRYRDPKRDSRIYIYRPSNQSEKLYNPINDPELLKRTMDILQEMSEDMKEKDLLVFIEKVYEGFPMEKTDAFQQAIKQYKESQKIRKQILDNMLDEEQVERTRLSKYETISVIPFSFYNQVKNEAPKNRIKYEVKVPYWYFFKHKKIRDGLLFCDLIYDKKLGAILEEDTSSCIL